MAKVVTTALLIFYFFVFHAQVAGDYRSFSSGTWNLAGTWETYNGAAWVAAGVPPTSANGTITIQTSHTVTITATVSIDQVVISAGAYLTITGGTVTIANGAGVDIILNGTLTEAQVTAPTWIAGATWIMGANGTLIKQTNTSSNNWQNNYSTGIANIPATSNWIIRRNTAVTIPLSSTMPASGSVYPNLTLENNVGGTWVMSTINSAFSGSTAYVTVKGNLDVGGAGTSTLDFTTSNTNATCTQIQGNLIVRTGDFLRNNGTGLEVKGNVTVSGTISYGGANGRNFIFSGTTAQTVNGAGSFSVYAMKMNNVGGSITLNRALTADNLVTFTSGILYTSATNLLTINTNGSVTGANNSSFVSGPIRYVGLGAFTFPVGKNSDYQALSYNTTPGGPFWTETFNNGCANACTANGVNTGNGAWTIDNSLNPAVDNCGQVPEHNVWYVSCKENGQPSGVCGAGCAGNATLHIGSTTAGDGGASFDAGGYCDLLGPGWGGGTNTYTMCASPSISTLGHTGITLSFDYISYGEVGRDWGWVDYSVDNGVTWNTMVNPIPPTTCCGGPCDNFHQGLWATYSTLLPVAAENIATFKIRFGWRNDDNSTGNDPSFAVNDIILSTPSPVCDFTCEYFHSDPNVAFNNVLAPTLGSISACEYWILTRNAGTENKILTLTWDANSCPAIPTISDTRVAHFDNTMWQDEGNGGNTGTTAAGTVTSAAAVTYFSPFTIGLIPSAPLPIEIVQFDGNCENNGVTLNWETASENNNEYFTIESSIDGNIFSPLGNLNGAGNSTQLLHYHFRDENPKGDVVYYRIKQTDYNGAFSYSRVIAVHANCNGNNLEVTHTWFHGDDLEIDYHNGNAPVQIEIYSADGKKINHFEELPTVSDYHIETSSLSSSIYFIRITDGFTTISKTVIKPGNQFNELGN